MYYLGSVLQKGFFAHTVMQQAFHRTEEALGALDVGVFSRNTSDAAIISNLLQGRTAAQGRIIYNANSAISMVQTFQVGVITIANTLERMSKIAAQAATGVYSGLEVAALQDGFNDLGKRIHGTAEETRSGPYRLLSGELRSVSLDMGPGFNVTLDSASLTVDTESLSLDRAPQAAVTAVTALRREALAYHGYLDAERGKLEQQIAMADYAISKAMGYGMRIPNAAFAMEVVQEVVAGVTEDKMVVLQAMGRPSAASLMLTQDNLEEPYRWLSS